MAGQYWRVAFFALAAAVLLVPATGWAAGASPGYAWDPGSRASWTDNRTLLTQGTEFVSPEADEALRSYVTTGATFEDLFPVPVVERDARARGLVLTGILAGMHRDFVKAGDGDRFLEGMRELVRLYDGEFPYPESWLKPESEQDRALVNRKAEVFAFLVSAYTRKNLSETFGRLKWPLTESVRSATAALERQAWDPATRDAMLKLLLKEGAPSRGAVAKAPPVSRPPPATAPKAAARPAGNEPAQFATIAPVPVTPRSIERGLAAPAVPQGAAPEAQFGGLFGKILDLGKSVVDKVVDTGKRIVDGGKKVVGAVVDGAKKLFDAGKKLFETVTKPFVDLGKWAWNGAKSIATGVRMMLPFRPKDMPKLTCKLLVFACQTEWRNQEQPEPGNRRNCKFLILGCEDGLYPNAKYRKMDGELFVQGPRDNTAIHPNDVSQGAIGDCYYMSSIAAVAQQRPDLIRDMIKANGDGTYSVTFHRWNGDKAEAVTVVVDNKFPTRQSESPLYAKAGDSELWPMVLEKAYAKFHGNSYVEIGLGGWPGNAMQELSGRKSSSFEAKAGPLKTLALSLSLGTGVVIDTPGSDDTKGNALYEGGRMVNLHAYWVKSVDLQKKQVTLVNPWGWGDDADLITLSEDEFHHSLRTVYVNPLH